ncbi:MAG: aldehyde dehydrogenase family protein, partial [Allosphingosinicella sp.]
MTQMSKIAPQPDYSEGARKALAREPALFIDGAWVRSTHDKLIDVYDPSTGKRIAQVVDASDADVDRAVAAARRAFDDGRWTGLSPYERQRRIEKLADLLEADMHAFAEIESIDNGKPRAASLGYDLAKSVQTLRYQAGWATKLNGEHVEPAGFPTGSVHAYIRREPVG